MAQPDMSFKELCELLAYTPKNRPLSTLEVSELLCVHVITVEQWRVTGGGPRFFKPEGTRRVWYSERDVLAWMAAGMKHNTSETIAA